MSSFFLCQHKQWACALHWTDDPLCTLLSTAIAFNINAGQPRRFLSLCFLFSKSIFTDLSKNLFNCEGGGGGGRWTFLVTLSFLLYFWPTLCFSVLICTNFLLGTNNRFFLIPNFKLLVFYRVREVNDQSFANKQRCWCLQLLVRNICSLVSSFIEKKVKKAGFVSWCIM